MDDMEQVRNELGGPSGANGADPADPKAMLLPPYETLALRTVTIPPPPGMLVEDLLLDEDITLWGGHGGAGKSTVALTAAIGVALGQPVFGTLPVYREGPVLLLAPEDGMSTVRMMVNAIASSLALSREQERLLDERLWVLPDEVHVDLTRDTARLGRTAAGIGAVLVVGDPIRNLLGSAEENSNDVAGRVLDAIRRDICRIAHCGMLLLGHLRKPGKDEGKNGDAAASVFDLRGAGGWVNGARLVFSIAKTGAQIALEALKANRLRKEIGHRLHLTIEAGKESPTTWTSCQLRDEQAGSASDSFTPGVGRATNVKERAALVALDDRQEPGRRLSWSAWRDSSALNENTFRSVKTRLIDAGLVAAVATGKRTPNNSPAYCYEITPNGRKTLPKTNEFPPVNGV